LRTSRAFSRRAFRQILHRKAEDLFPGFKAEECPRKWEEAVKRTAPPIGRTAFSSLYSL
jgi:hypothetical protein